MNGSGAWRAGLRTAAFACALLATTAHPAGPVLYEKASAYGSVVITDEGNGLRALRFGRDGVRQSLVKPGDPEYLGLAYLPVALTGLALCEEPRRFLVVGLGGGTLPGFLRHHYPESEIDAVDINPEVVAAAKSHFGFREDARMRIHIADGRRFIESARQPYDVIFLDAFGADAVPAHLTTREFLSAVRRAVHPRGVVVGNLWSVATDPPYDSMVRTYRDTFDELQVLRVSGTNNRILLALPRTEGLNRGTLAALARRLAAAKNFRFNPGLLVERGLMPADLASGGGRVLNDADIPVQPARKGPLSP
ncbi:MAG: fused MFS/spermidine synthase [Burkholderiales bacterium]|nr:fused MFS/spermidine synthase [Burkholderiales bacterium]